jgi:DNA-binding NtrC family response regulator
MADFIARAGIEVLPLPQRHRAALYVDFVGARPGGTEVLSIAFKETTNAALEADLVTENWPAAACLVISRLLGLHPPLVSADSEMMAVIKSAIGVARTHIPVILNGEVGTGKSSLARLIHHAAGSRGLFLTADCGSFDQFTLESTPQGAVTPPHDPAAVPPTTIFLNEIGELSETAQVKLLHMLQPAVATGSSQLIASPARFLAATNRSLPVLMERGLLRRELFWRLNVFQITVAPLRQRAGDISLAARYFLRKANRRRVFAPMTLKVMAGYAFPGNLLELENLVTRLAIAPLTTGSSVIEVSDLRRHLVVSTINDRVVNGWKTSREMARREMILQTIAAAGGNRVEAARRLGITLRALQYHITKAGLSRRRRATVVAVPAQGISNVSRGQQPGWEPAARCSAASFKPAGC